MAKQKNSFVVTVTTEGPVKPSHLASWLRETLNDTELCPEDVAKVTVSPVGER